MSFERPEAALLPAEPDLLPLHQRQYLVRAWRVDDHTMLLRGAVEDRKPGRDWPGSDEESLVMHHMVVDLTVAYPDLTIRTAEVRLEVHPQSSCPRIADHYKQLEGLSIARGFTQKVRERFGGPRGCTHTTALLQAMAPVAVQCMWSMQPPGAPEGGARGETAFLRNTCHVWAEDGEMWDMVRRGEPIPVPIPVSRRMHDAGLDPGRLEPG